MRKQKVRGPLSVLPPILDPFRFHEGRFARFDHATATSLGAMLESRGLDPREACDYLDRAAFAVDCLMGGRTKKESRRHIGATALALAKAAALLAGMPMGELAAIAWLRRGQAETEAWSNREQIIGGMEAWAVMAKRAAAAPELEVFDQRDKIETVADMVLEICADFDLPPEGRAGIAAETLRAMLKLSKSKGSPDSLIEQAKRRRRSHGGKSVYEWS